MGNLWNTPAGGKFFDVTDEQLAEMEAELKKLDIAAIIEANREKIEERLQPYRTKVTAEALFRFIW